MYSAPPVTPPHQSLLRRIGGFLGRTTAATVVSLLIGVLGGFLWGRLTAHSAPPSVEVQLAQLREAAARHHEVLFIRPGSLHGGLSYVVVSEEPMENYANLGRSDELRIYDVTHGRLTLAFDFRPAKNHGERWRYRLDGIEDLEDTGAQEVIGGLSLLIDSGGTRVFIPTIVSWSDAANRYVIEPLLPEPAIGYGAPKHFHSFIGVGGAAWWQLETQGVTVKDTISGRTFHAYGGLDFVVKTISSFRAPSGTGLVILGVVGAVHDDTPITLVSGWVLNPTLPRVTVGLCPSTHPTDSTVHLVVGDLRSQIVRAYGTPAEC